MKSYKVKICVPCYKGQINKKLLHVIAEIMQEHPEGSEIEYTYSAWSTVFADISRNEAICPSNLLFPELPFVNLVVTIDADMEPTKDNIYNLVQSAIDNQLHCVTALYKKNSEDGEFCVQIQPGPSQKTRLSGLIPVFQSGFGLGVISTQLLSQIPKPWFNHYFVVNQENGTFKEVPEDESFCHKVRETGNHVYCNFDILIEHDIIPKKHLMDMMTPVLIGNSEQKQIT